MEMPSKHALYLSKRIGSRGAGSDGEAAAASYVMRTFRDWDLEVEMENFSTWKSDTPALIVLFLLAIASYLVFELSEPASLAISLFVFFVFQMETYTWATISRLMPHSGVFNVVGRVRSAGATRERVVLVANYDTAKSSPTGRRHISRAYRLLYVLSFVCIIAIVLLGFFGVGADLTKISEDTVQLVWFFTSPFTLYLLFFAALLMFGETRGRYTAGANDNASGLSVMMSAMEHVAGNVPEHTEVWGVATGRSSAGARGMVAFLRRHRHQLHSAYYINIDHCGVGQTKVITREGPMFGFHSSRKLKRMAFNAAAGSNRIDLGKGKCRVKKSDGMAAMVRGYRAITIGGVDGGTYPGWRNKEDTLDTIERASLERAVRLTCSLVAEIDRASAKKLEGRRSRREKREKPREADAPDRESVLTHP